MKFIVIATRSETHAAEEFAPHLAPETKYAFELWADDFVRMIHGRADGKGAILEAEAADQAEVEAKLNELPLVKAGMLSLEIFGIVPYRGIGNAAAMI